MPKRFLSLLLVLSALLSLGACAGELTTPGEPLRVLGPTLPNAILHEPYQQAIHVVGGLRPYDYRIEDGSLPAGITLQNGTFRGGATVAGTFEMSVKITDASLNQVVQDFVLRVTAPPPPSFSLAVPLTEVRDAVTLRATVSDARAVTAVRSLVRWDPALFALSAGGVSPTGRGTKVLWREAEGELQVDLIALGSTIDGERELYRFTLEPLETPTRLRVDYQVEFLADSSDPNRRHDYARASEGRSPARSAGGSDPSAPEADTPEAEQTDMESPESPREDPPESDDGSHYNDRGEEPQ